MRSHPAFAVCSAVLFVNYSIDKQLVTMDHILYIFLKLKECIRYYFPYCILVGRI